MTGWVGRTAERRVKVSSEVVDAFVALSGDASPIHVADSEAIARGFSGRVAHGMLLGAWLSAVIGTELPGAAGVLQEVKLSFRHPCYVGDDVVIAVAVTDFIESVQVVEMRVTITNQQGRILVSGSVQSGVRQM